MKTTETVFAKHSGIRRVPVPGWFDAIKVGDVLKTPSKDYRVVRAVTRYANGPLHSIVLTIRKCSWTHRPYTHLNYTDLRARGFMHTGVNVADKFGAFDELLADAVCDETLCDLDCCDVKGCA